MTVTFTKVIIQHDIFAFTQVCVLVNVYNPVLCLITVQEHSTSPADEDRHF